MAKRRRVRKIRNFLIMIALISISYFIYSKITSSLARIRSGQYDAAATERDKISVSRRDASGRCTRKNVLLLISDDLRPQLGSYNGRDFPTPLNPMKMYTPNLDRLARKSLLLKRAYSQISSCGPSRSSFLTSRRPDTTKVWDLKTYWRDSGGNFTTLPQYFKENGYRTASIGKVFHPELSSDFDDPISWTEPIYHPPNMPYWSYVFTVGVSWKAVTRKERREKPLEDEQTTNETLHVLKTLAAGAKSCEEPFFLATGFHKPHLPFVFPEEYLDYYPMRKMEVPNNYYAPYNMPEIAWQDFIELRRFVDMKPLGHSGSINETFSSRVTKQLRRAYYASVSYIDDLAGSILSEVKNLGLAEDTIVAFIGDHGFHLGENDQWAKHSNFEQGVRTPVMLHIPGVTDNGIASRSLVELVDLYPSLAEAAGLPQVPRCPYNSTDIKVCTEGTSFVPLIQDPKLELKEVAISQHRRVGLKMGYTMRTDRYRYTEWVQYHRTWNKNNNWDYDIGWDNPIGVELYDHDRDPEENSNQGYNEKYEEIRTMLSEKLHDSVGYGIYDVKSGRPSGLKEDMLN